MEEVVRASQVKFNFDHLKDTWKEMLSKYYDEDGSLYESAVVNVPCPYCNQAEYRDPFLLNGFQHVTCNTCETLYVTPRLQDDCISELYSDSYYSAQYIKAMIPAFDVRKRIIGQNKYKQIVSFIDSTTPGRVLDIGSGLGEVSDVFRDNSWKTSLVEMNPVAIDWLHKRNHNHVFHGSFDDYKSDEKYNVIMAWGVLEHVVNPQAFLKKVYNLLEPGGVFVSEVPHGNCLLVDFSRKMNIDPERILMGEQHIVLYSIEAYSGLHKSVGLEKVHIQTNGLDLETILNISNENLSDSTIYNIQKCIDKKNYGDLLRGYWTK